MKQPVGRIIVGAIGLGFVGVGVRGILTNVTTLTRGRGSPGLLRRRSCTIWSWLLLSAWWACWSAGSFLVGSEPRFRSVCW